MKLFVVAGPAGAGKSTLIQQCILKKLPLFGEYSDDFYRFTPLKIPPREIASLIGEQRVPARRRGTQLPAKLHTYKFPATIDEASQCQLRTLALRPSSLASFQGREFQNSKTYDEILIATIVISQKEVRNRYNKRAEARKRHETRSIRGLAERKIRHLTRFFSTILETAMNRKSNATSRRSLYSSANQEQYEEMYRSWIRHADEVATRHFILRFSDDGTSVTVLRRSGDDEVPCANFHVVADFLLPIRTGSGNPEKECTGISR